LEGEKGGKGEVEEESEEGKWGKREEDKALKGKKRKLSSSFSRQIRPESRMAWISQLATRDSRLATRDSNQQHINRLWPARRFYDSPTPPFVIV